MADISKITINNGNEYNIKDSTARERLAEFGNAKIFYGTCDTAANVVAKEVVCPEFGAENLTVGAIIFVTFDATNTGAVASLTMDVNETGAKPIRCVRNGAISNLASAGDIHANNTLIFNYDGTNWTAVSLDYNHDTTYAVFDSLVHTNGAFIADSVIYRYQLCFHVDKNRITPLNNVSNGYKNTNKAILTEVEFDPFGEIYYYATTAGIAKNDNAAATYMTFAKGDVDLRYSLNISASVNALTAAKDVYMKVIPLSNGKVKLAAAFPLVQELPDTNDGYLYIFLGRAYSTYQMSLYPHHPVYYHDGTSVRRLCEQDGIVTSLYAGLMSSEDKAKLDAIDANVIIVQLSVNQLKAATSPNIVQYTLSQLISAVG